MRIYDTMPSKEEGSMAKTSFSDHRINLYLQPDKREKIQQVGEKLLREGVTGIVKRNGEFNVSAIFEVLLDRELSRP
jgi:hypothetical protein